jgi:hypothetical protein
VHVLRYYETLSHQDIGNGFFHRPLENFHQGPNLPAVRNFYSVPRTLTEIERPEVTPLDHPLRAIAGILDDAAGNRVYFCHLTDPVAIDLLIHAGATKTVQVIMQCSL